MESRQEVLLVGGAGISLQPLMDDLRGGQYAPLVGLMWHRGSLMSVLVGLKGWRVLTPDS